MNKLITSLIVSGFSMAAFATTTASTPATPTPTSTAVAPAAVAPAPSTKAEVKADHKTEVKKSAKDKTAHKDDTKK